MSAYNTLTATVRCPHCGSESDLQIDFRFGLLDLLEYRLGDRVVWTGCGSKVPAQRPEDGDFDGEGYAECPVCRRAFWTRIKVRSDVIVAVEIDWDRENYPCPP